jgi:hypothetical protein
MRVGVKKVPVVIFCMWSDLLAASSLPSRAHWLGSFQTSSEKIINSLLRLLVGELINPHYLDVRHDH